MKNLKTLRGIVTPRICLYIVFFFIISILVSIGLGGENAGSVETPHQAIVTYTDGFVDVMYKGSEEWAALVEGDRLEVGDTIETGTEGAAELKLADGSVIKVGPDSRVLIKELGMVEVTKVTTTTFGLLRGRIRAIVNPFLKKESSFMIETENATVGVRGTDFGTIYDPDTGATNVISISDCVSVVATNFPDIDPIDVCTKEEILVYSDKEPGEVVGVDAEKLKEFLEEMEIKGEGTEVSGELEIEPPYITGVFVNKIINLEDIDEFLTLTKGDLSFDGKVLVSGTATDDAYAIDHVEVSIDGGVAWDTADGTSNWSFEFIPETDIEYELLVKAINEMGVESDPYELGPWYISHLDLDYEDIAKEFLEDLKSYAESGDITSIEDMVSDDYDGSASGLYSKYDLIDSILMVFDSGADISVSFSINQVTGGSIIVSTGWSSTVGAVNQSGTLKFWLSEMDDYKLIHTEGEWFLGKYLYVEEELYMEQFDYAFMPCNNMVRILLTVPGVPMDVNEIEIEVEAETCTPENRTLTRSYYESETGMDVGFGAELVIESVTDCGDPHLCGTDSIMYVSVYPNLGARFNEYGYSLEEWIPLP